MSSKKMAIAAVATTLAMTAATSAQAQEQFWEFSAAPYLWGAGVDADVTVGGRTASVERDFGDIVDALDIGGGLMAGARLGRFVMATQLDYMSLDSDNLDDALARSRLETDLFLAMLAMGVRLGSLTGGSHWDVLLGARNLSLDNTLTLDGIGKFEGDKDLVDPIIVVRPSFRLSDRWRLNATFSYGQGGDSEKTWELQPHVEYRITDHVALRFGYRRLYYDIESDNGLNEFDGSFQGLVFGVGGTFGRAPLHAARSAQPLSPAPVAATAARPSPPPAAAPAPRDTDADGVADHIDKSSDGRASVDAHCGFLISMPANCENDGLVAEATRATGESS